MPDRRSLSNVRRALTADGRVIADGERLGGAVFDFSACADRLGMPVEFISATGERAAEVALAGDSPQIASEAPTGIVSVRLEVDRQPGYSIHRPAAYDFARLDGVDLEPLAALDPQWEDLLSPENLKDRPLQTA